MISAPSDWSEFHEVLKGNGPCNAERMAARRKAWTDGPWFREGLMAHADKAAARQHPSRRRNSARMAAESGNQCPMNGPFWKSSSAASTG